jgi:UDP-glucose:tetrahydrobiopterin glucosyltransferase
VVIVRITLASTPVGPLGSGEGGGVELTLYGMATGLIARGHEVTVVAPAGSLSVADARLVLAHGQAQVPSQTTDRQTPITLPASPVLGAMWDEVHRLVADGETDVVVNLAYDWLPLYLTPYLVSAGVKVAHLVSMGSLNDAMDDIVTATAFRFPQSCAVHSRAQADTFPAPDQFVIVGNGLDVTRYRPVARPGDHLAFVGRISPEKGLEDAVEAAWTTGRKLRVYGLLQDEPYWRKCVSLAPDLVSYGGFLPTDELAVELATAAALIVTPKWVEAFGNVAMEALACGVPVLAYDRGGPAEIVSDGQNGWIVPADDVRALTEAIGRIDAIDRSTCRRSAEDRYSLDAFAHRLESWFALL